MLVELGVVEQRYDAVKEVLDGGGTVTEVRGALRRDPPEPAQLAPAPPRARDGRPGRSLQATEELPAPDAGPSRTDGGRAATGASPVGTVASCLQLERKGTEPVPSRSSIHRILVRSGLVEPRARRRKRSDYIRWERAQPMELWQLDVVEARLQDGAAVKILTGIDEHASLRNSRAPRVSQEAVAFDLRESSGWETMPS